MFSVEDLNNLYEYAKGQSDEFLNKWWSEFKPSPRAKSQVIGTIGVHIEPLIDKPLTLDRNIVSIAKLYKVDDIIMERPLWNRSDHSMKALVYAYVMSCKEYLTGYAKFGDQ